jgi:hypothetical protein
LTISAIARHTGRDRKTVRAHLNGTRSPRGAGAQRPGRVEVFVADITARFDRRPLLWARTLCDEREDLGYTQSYQMLTRQILTRNLRPVCPQFSLISAVQIPGYPNSQVAGLAQ